MPRKPALLENGKPKYDIDTMIQEIRLYTNVCLEAKTGFPILKECCILNDWDYDYVMKLQREHEGLRQSIKRLLAQKEICLEKLGACGLIDKTMAVFSLKQLGWRDKMDIAVETVPPVSIINDIPRPVEAKKEDKPDAAG